MKVLIAVMVEEEFKKKIQEYCVLMGLNKSSFVRMAIIKEMMTRK